MEAITNAKTDPEIRREKVAVPNDMSLKQIMEKHGISKTCAWNAQKRGWFIKNYSRNQIIIDKDHFNPEPMKSTTNGMVSGGRLIMA